MKRPTAPEMNSKIPMNGNIINNVPIFSTSTILSFEASIGGALAKVNKKCQKAAHYVASLTFMA